MAKGKKTGGGSRKGIPNAITSDLRAMVRGALEGVGGQEYLQAQAYENPVAFMALVGKCLPKEVDLTVGEPITIRWAGEKPK